MLAMLEFLGGAAAMCAAFAAFTALLIWADERIGGCLSANRRRKERTT